MTETLIIGTILAVVVGTVWYIYYSFSRKSLIDIAIADDANNLILNNSLLALAAYRGKINRFEGKLLKDSKGNLYTWDHILIKE